jgi:hypothetical protein
LSRFSEWPDGSPGIVTDVVIARTPARTAAGPTIPLAPTYKAAAPATVGLDMLVPDLTVVPPPIAVDRMSTPGATTDMLAPKLLKVAQQSSHP